MTNFLRHPAALAKTLAAASSTLALSITVLSACDRAATPPAAYFCPAADDELDASEFGGANGSPVPADPADPGAGHAGSPLNGRGSAHTRERADMRADAPIPCPAQGTR